MSNGPSTPAAPRLPEWLTTTPIAHRGLHTLPAAPENSLAAFAAAADAGYAIELDVRLLADGKVVVFHDGDLGRMTGMPGAIAERTVADLRDLRLQGTQEPIPLLAEALQAVSGRVPFLIELKVSSADAKALTDATLDILSAYTGAVAIQAFDADTVAYLSERAPAVLRGQLSSGGDAWQADAAGNPRPQPDFLAYNVVNLPTPLSSALRARGVPLLAWTVRTQEQLRRATEVADNVIFEDISPR